MSAYPSQPIRPPAPPGLATLITPPQQGAQQQYIGTQSPWNLASHAIPVMGANGRFTMPGGGTQSTYSGLLGQAQSLIGAETERAQELMGGRYSQGQNGNFERNQAPINSLGGLLQGAGSRMQGTVDVAGQPISALDAQMQGLLRSQQGQFNDYASSTIGNLDQGMSRLNGLIDQGVGFANKIPGAVDLANKEAQDAIGTARGAAATYAQRTQENIAGAVAGFAQQAQSSIKQANSRFNPDGSIKSPDQMAAERYQIQGEVGLHQAQVVSSMQADFQNNLAALNMQVAGFQTKAADTALSGGQLLGAGGSLLNQLAGTHAQGQQISSQTRLGLGNQQQELQKGQRDMLGMVQGLRQFWAQTKIGTQLSTLQLQAGGFVNQAQLQTQNPEGLASLFSGLATMFGMATAPGSGGLPQMNFTNQQA